jgi:EmrB/QacA subfamily drug resistance transporter
MSSTDDDHWSAMTTSHEHSRLLLPIILAASFMYGFDLNVVNVALPSLQHELHAGQTALELVVGGYTFTYAAGLVTGGRLGDLFGYRRMFLAGMAGFTFASVLCGLASTPGELVAARLLQGLAAAAMVPQVLALITAIYTSQQRARALAWFGVSAAISGVCGQVLGGLLLVADVFGWGWRAIFFLNLPVGLFVIALASRILPAPDINRRRPRLDPVGVLAVSGSLALALIPLVLGRSQGWPAWTWLMLAAAVPAFILSLGYERRLARAGGTPLLDLSLFTSRSFRIGICISSAFMSYFISGVFVISLLLQSGLGLTPLRAGLSFAPMALAGIAGALLGRRLIPRYGPARTIQTGCAIYAAATLLLALVLHTQHGAADLHWLILGMGFMGLGGTLILPAMIGATLTDVRPAQAGAASGTLNTTQQFAGTAGLAAIGSVFFSRLGTRPNPATYATATETALWIGLALIAVMAILSTLLVRHTPPAQDPATALTTLADSPALSARGTPTP